MLVIEDWRPGHYDNRPMQRALRSGRVGSRGQRTFHHALGSVRGGGGIRPAIGYATDEGREDLEGVAGDQAALEEAAEAIARTARLKNGPTAERTLVTERFEFPSDSSPGQRRQLALAWVAAWRERGYVAVCAIHGNGREQPHGHGLIAARPTRRVAGEIVVDRSPATRLFVGKEAVRARRGEIAEAVNEICEPAVQFHPGRLIDTGITRRAKRRVSQRAWHVQQRRSRDLEAVAAARARHDQARDQATALREARADARARRLERRGLVRESTLTAAMKAAGAAVDRLKDQASGIIKRVSAERDVARAVSARARSYAADRLKAAGLELPASFDTDARVQSDVWAVVRKHDQAALERLRQTEAARSAGMAQIQKLSAELVSQQQAEAARARPTMPAQSRRPRDFER